MFHRHIWRITEIEPSAFERTLALGGKAKLNSGSTADTRILNSKVVRYECVCGAQKAERV